MNKHRVQIGRLTLWLWAGSWSWFSTENCAHCWNRYVGPFGVGWTRVESASEGERA